VKTQIVKVKDFNFLDYLRETTGRVINLASVPPTQNLPTDTPVIPMTLAVEDVIGVLKSKVMVVDPEHMIMLSQNLVTDIVEDGLLGPVLSVENANLLVMHKAFVLDAVININSGFDHMLGYHKMIGVLEANRLVQTAWYSQGIQIQQPAMVGPQYWTKLFIHLGNDFCSWLIRVFSEVTPEHNFGYALLFLATTQVLLSFFINVESWTRREGGVVAIMKDLVESAQRALDSTSLRVKLLSSLLKSTGSIHTYFKNNNLSIMMGLAVAGPVMFIGLSRLQSRDAVVKGYTTMIKLCFGVMKVNLDVLVYSCIGLFKALIKDYPVFNAVVNDVSNILTSGKAFFSLLLKDNPGIDSALTKGVE
jgi:hypothetical protein